jgi:exosortase
LQRLATVVSTFLLQTLGLPAVAEGNRILMNEQDINIVEACSGLRMLVVFFALSAGMALLVNRRMLDRMILLGSAIPIALIANVIRITVTGFLLENVSGETAHWFFHDLAGWFMMPLALALLGLEIWILNKLFLEPSHDGPMAVQMARTQLTRPIARKRQPWKNRGTDIQPNLGTA